MRILYLEGDTCAPKYVEAALRYVGLDVLRTHGEVPADWKGDLIVVSDVDANALGAGAKAIVDRVHAGASLLLVGGWHSFGKGGWARTPLAEVSPVEIAASDDRVNVPSGVFLRRAEHHPVLDGLPWEAPPVITGYNLARPRADASVVVQGYAVEEVGEEVAGLAGLPVPILALGSTRGGRTAAFLSDFAPHWSGGLTDWGPPPIDVGAEQLGGAYVRFLAQLCGWLAGTPTQLEKPEKAEAEKV